MIQQFFVAWKVEMIDGTACSGSVGVPSTSPAAACRQVAGAIRNQYGSQAEDVSTTCIGPA